MGDLNSEACKSHQEQFYMLIICISAECYVGIYLDFTAK